ncbi:MAG: hypothetical protein KDA85_12220 [Planctomycetaceae bacterium]|nr:hypothetical protein [Planctomycetaceae bacterium]
MTSFRDCLRLSVALAAVWCADPAVAQHVGWRPGDAMFAAHGRVEVHGDMQGGKKEILFEHQASPPAGEGWFDGYAGFLKLSVIGEGAAVDHVTRSIEAVLHRRRDQEDLSKPHFILVYNANFRFERFSIGLCYNEHWSLRPEQKPLGDRRASPIPMLYYSTLMKSQKGVIEDWANASSVAPLKLVVPADREDWGLAGDPIWKPLTIDLSSVVFCVCETDAVEPCCLRTVGAVFHVIHSDGRVFECTWQEFGRLEQKRIQSTNSVTVP